MEEILEISNLKEEVEEIWKQVGKDRYNNSYDRNNRSKSQRKGSRDIRSGKLVIPETIVVHMEQNLLIRMAYNTGLSSSKHI